MSNNRHLNQVRGITLPVDNSLVKVLSNLREQNHKASSDGQRFVLTGRDMLMLGRLISAWKDIVGIQLAHKTCPARVVRGKLYLTVSDSQWLQTLTFIKPKILEKLGKRFPQFRISDIVGRPGKIPPEVEKMVKEAEWPEWETLQDMPLPENLDPELAETISRCRKKLAARVEGLKDRGFNLCVCCRASMTSSEEGICAMCHFESRSEILMRVRSLLNEMPWLGFDEVLECECDIKNYEFDAIQTELLDESIEMVHEYSLQLSEKYSEDLFCLMKKEMIRAIMFHTGCMPDQVDLFHLEKNQLLVPDWLEYLAFKPEEEAC